MSWAKPIEELAALSRSFGVRNARKKLDLLERIAGQESIGARAMLSLYDTLCFLRAYPDDAQVLDAAVEVGAELRDRVEALPKGVETSALQDHGFPGSFNTHYYSFGVLRHLVRLFPGSLEIAWDELEDEIPLHNALILLVSPGERQGLDDINITWEGWLERCKSHPEVSDLEFILGFFERAELALEVKGQLFDSCGLPIRFWFDRPGSARLEHCHAPARIHYQREEIDRRRVPLEPHIEEPFKETKHTLRSVGRELLELSHAALSCRSLEILMLTWADPGDVRLLDCGRGLQVLLIGSLPETRDPYNTSYFQLVLKNGVPIGYGPASICLGTCEMGLNLFPAFRGGEVPFIWGQLMRAFHQVLGAHYFYLTSYGMGSGNPAAIRTGAFWFYRKLGFRAELPEIEELARSEEERMRAEPGYRSDRRMLHRLSVTDAYLDLSGGRCRRVDQGRWGNRLTRFIDEEFGGDRSRAEATCGRRVARQLGISKLASWSPDEKQALRSTAPILCLIPGIAGWSAADRARAVRFIRAKGGRSEAGCDRMLLENEPLLEGLRCLGW